MRRRCGSGGKSHSFCAMYSLKMSVCNVPSSCEMLAPCRSAATRYMQNTGTAGPLIVIDVVVRRPGGRPVDRRDLHAGERREVGVALAGGVVPRLPALPSILDVLGVHARSRSLVPLRC